MSSQSIPRPAPESSRMQPIGCREPLDDETLDGFIDGFLPMERELAVDAHLTECAACAGRYIELQREAEIVGEALRIPRAPGWLGDDLVRDLRRRVQEARNGVYKSPILSPARSRRSYARVIGALGVAVITALIGLTLYSLLTPKFRDAGPRVARPLPGYGGTTTTVDARVPRSSVEEAISRLEEGSAVPLQIIKELAPRGMDALDQLDVMQKQRREDAEFCERLERVRVALLAWHANGTHSHFRATGRMDDGSIVISGKSDLPVSALVSGDIRYVNGNGPPIPIRAQIRLDGSLTIRQGAPGVAKWQPGAYLVTLVFDWSQQGTEVRHELLARARAATDERGFSATGQLGLPLSPREVETLWITNGPSDDGGQAALEDALQYRRLLDRLEVIDRESAVVMTLVEGEAAGSTGERARTVLRSWLEAKSERYDRQLIQIRDALRPFERDVYPVRYPGTQASMHLVVDHLIRKTAALAVCVAARLGNEAPPPVEVRTLQVTDAFVGPAIEQLRADIACFSER
jgi:hypothetical protein